MFSEKDKAYHLYQSRMDYLRQQKTIQRNLEHALKEKNEALKEIEKLKKRLEQAGIKP